MRWAFQLGKPFQIQTGWRTHLCLRSDGNKLWRWGKKQRAIPVPSFLSLSLSLSLSPISFSSIISPIIDFEFDSILIIYQTRVETSIGKIDRIITSPFLRCLETARPLSLSLNLPLLVDYSLFEGELISLITLRTNSSRIISSYTRIIFLGSLFC